MLRRQLLRSTSVLAWQCRINNPLDLFFEEMGRAQKRATRRQRIMMHELQA